MTVAIFKVSPAFWYKSSARASPAGFPLQSGLGGGGYCINSLATVILDGVEGSFIWKVMSAYKCNILFASDPELVFGIFHADK